MAYKARNKIGRFAENSSEQDSQSVIPSDLKVGVRVKVEPVTERDIERIGTVLYLGSTDFAPGIWVGLQYDEPVGKNDGSVEGRRYFDCRHKYGGFVKPERCLVGEWQSLDSELDFDSD
jgi:tubulin-folding cofactor B